MMVDLPDSDDGGSHCNDESEHEAPTVRKKPAGKRSSLKRPASVALRKPGPTLKDVLAALIITMTIGYEWPMPAKLDFCVPRYAFWEIYSPPRVSLHLNHDRICFKNFDLETGWDMLIHWKLFFDTYLSALPRPHVLLMCPPCTPFSALMHSNWWRMAVETREQKLREGLWHLMVTCALITYHVKCGGFYIFEHPDKATSWSVPALAKLPGETRVIDQCSVGLQAPDGLPIRKRTKIKTNIPWLISELSSEKYQCTGDHCHATVAGKIDGRKMSTWSQVYPPGLCDVFARAVNDVTIN